MGDHRAGSTGSTATTVAAPPTQPYVGRRVAQVAPMPVDALRGAEALPYAGRRVAGRNPVVRRSPVEAAPPGRRIALDPELSVLADDADDVVGHLLRPTAASTLETYVGRRVARTVDLITEPTVVKPVVLAPPVVEPKLEPVLEPVLPPEPLVETPSPEIPRVLVAPVVDPVEESLTAAPALSTPLVTEPALVEPVIEMPVIEDLVVQDHLVEDAVLVPPMVEEPGLLIDAPELVETVLAVHPELDPEADHEPDHEPHHEPHHELDEPATRPTARRIEPKQSRPSGRRAASRRTRVPSLPLLAGVAVLAVSAAGALQAAQPDLTGTDGRISPASALSGSSAVGSASLLGRGAAVSRDSDRAASSAGGGSLRAAADAQAKERDAALSALAGKAEKQAAEIKLHAWVLPITPGVYHLTARFGDYSSLWSHFHTGLDFAAPTGTPIMAVAGGTITEVGYSGAYGNRTIERLADGTELWYCHQNEFGTSVGATVKPGQVIGYVGSTGNVTGPHLHLEVHPGGGDPVDPFTALQVHGLNP